jgi:hypothetical protein
MNLKKLTIEIEGKPLTPLLKIYADGKQLGRLTNLKITADDDDILVNIELMQTKIVEVNGKKEVVQEPLVLKWGN